jgi:hypothetical protein
MKLLTVADTVLLPISFQNRGQKFGCDTMDAKFSSQNQLACSITNFDVIRVLNSSTLILTNELLKFGYSFRRCGTDGRIYVFVILSGCPTSPELSMSFKHSCTAYAFFSERSSNRSQGLHRTFSKFCTELYTHSPFLCQIRQKCYQAIHTTPNKRM